MRLSKDRGGGIRQMSVSLKACFCLYHISQEGTPPPLPHSFRLHPSLKHTKGASLKAIALFYMQPGDSLVVQAGGLRRLRTQEMVQLYFFQVFPNHLQYLPPPQGRCYSFHSSWVFFDPLTCPKGKVSGSVSF